jgi:cystathionine gamma-lyase
VNVPIYLSSTFAQSAPNRHRGYVYSRSANPTRSALEAALAGLEGGAVGLAFSSGLAALATLLDDLAPGDRVVAGEDLYGGTLRLLEHRRRHQGLVPVYVDLRATASVEAALAEGPTALVLAESPTNPLMQLCDLKATARRAHDAGAAFAVDNTVASPALQRPIEHGADVVVHSMTKYLGGHSDIVGGALVVRDRARGERLRWLQNAIGSVPSPVDCYLVLRGLKTLGLRMRRHSENGRAVARALEASSKVVRTYYPGLASHPQRALAARQMDGMGGMVSAELRGGGRAARRFLRALRVFTLAESLGGVESLVDHPATMTHASVPARDRRRRGIGDGLLRFSCGVEDPADLVDDARRALRGI